MNVYQDIDGDIWIQREDGKVSALTDYGVSVSEPYEGWRSFEGASRNFGPLVRLVRETGNG